MSPSDPPLGADVLTVLLHFTFVTAVVDKQACKDAPAAVVPRLSSSKIVLTVAAQARLCHLLIIVNTHVTADNDSI